MTPPEAQKLAIVANDIGYLHSILLLMRELGRGTANPMNEGDRATIRATFDVLRDMAVRWSAQLEAGFKQ